MVLRRISPIELPWAGLGRGWGQISLKRLHSKMLSMKEIDVIHLLADSTSLEKKHDKEAKVGYSTTKGFTMDLRPILHLMQI